MFVCSSILYEWDAACMLGINTVGHGKRGYIDKARQGSEGSDDPRRSSKSSATARLC